MVVKWFFLFLHMYFSLRFYYSDPLLPNHLSKQFSSLSLFATFPGFPCSLFIGLSWFFLISLFCVLTKARTARLVIRPPLISIRFIGLEKHPAGCSQSFVHICTESVLSCWPIISLPLTELYGPTFTQTELCGQTSSKRTCKTALMCRPNVDESTSALTSFMLC